MKKMVKKNKKKKRNKKNICNFYYLPIRYIILLILMFSMPIIYFIFTPLTVYPVLGLLKIFFKEIFLFGDILVVNLNSIEIVGPCIAGSAYLLLLILNLTVPMNIKKRIYSILVSFLMLLVLNILRIFLLIVLYVKEFVFFDFTHKLFWYFLSSIFVVAIWFFIVKIFSIKEIPVYTDVRFLMNNIRKKKRK
ncbi:pacearchaeosortase [Candidatus Pacearchaeota archaeon]|nr:pacearchaeosortase [Candidatus Pacearchaeota archaeon]MBD3283697.1 pacearchaeosortase [Candidatus Pacearchaeota archaeon]